jgi:hypothetical protein
MAARRKPATPPPPQEGDEAFREIMRALAAQAVRNHARRLQQPAPKKDEAEK